MPSGLVFIGGGRAAASLMELFSSDKDIIILAVVDRNPNAVGVKLARSRGIPVLDEMEPAIKMAGVDVVVEVTGNINVRRSVIEQLQPHQEIMTARGARAMVDMVGRQNEVRSRLSTLVGGMENSVTGVDGIAQAIDDVLGELKIVTLNANITAARLGQSGNMFIAIVKRMQELISDISNAVDGVKSSSKESRRMLIDLKDTEKALRFGEDIQ